MGHSLEEDLPNSNSLDRHWSCVRCDVRCDEIDLSMTKYIPEDKVICRPLRPWREEPEEKLESISYRNLGNIEKHAHLSGLIFLVANREESGP